MINPCKPNKSYILGNSIYNLLTPVTPRYSIEYVKPTPDMFKKHKQLILKYSTLTNGPGFVSNDDINTQIYYKLNVDSVQFRNTIFRIPCRFRPYIKDGTILNLLNQGNSIQTVFKLLTTQYNIPDPTLTSTNIYQFKRLYTYPEPSYIINTAAVVPIANISSVSYKTVLSPISNPPSQFLPVQLLSINNVLLPKIEWHRILNLSPDIFVMIDYCQFIQVLNNDGKTFTSNFNDLYSSASYHGSAIVKNTVYSPTIVFKLPVLIIPQEQNRPKTYGYIINTNRITELYNLIDRILFIPVQLVTTIIDFEPYPANMPFTIKTNTELSKPKPLCYVKPIYTNT